MKSTFSPAATIKPPDALRKFGDGIRRDAEHIKDTQLGQFAENAGYMMRIVASSIEHSQRLAAAAEPGGIRFRCERFLAVHPLARLHLRSLYKHFVGTGQQFIDATERAEFRATTPGELPGEVSLRVDVAAEILNLMTAYGAWATLGVIPMETGKTKFAKVTGQADGYVLTPANRGTAITADASITGGSVQTDCPTIATLVEASRELTEDGKTTFEGALMEAITNGLNRRLDHICLMASGTDDQTDGGMTGIFSHASVPDYTAAAGNTSVAALEFADFAGTIGAVSASALQRACHWWINPAFLPSLLGLKDDGEKILKPPTTAGGLWMLAGFPVVWSAAAPGTDGASKQIAAFGRGDCYTVGIRQSLELARSELGTGFATLKVLFRALIRAEGVMMDANSFAILNTPAA